METIQTKHPHHAEPRSSEIGFAVSVKHYLITLEGLPSARIEDILVHEEGGRAMVVFLSHNQLQAIMVDTAAVRPGDRFFLNTEKLFFSFGDHLYGRVINALGEPLDGKKTFPRANAPFRIDTEALGVSKRTSITEQLLTGITLVDILLPIAKGQRQLIFGPLHSGKTTFLEDVVINQRSQDIVCIYAAMGKPLSAAENLMRRLLSRGQEEQVQKTIIVLAPSNAGAPLIAITPSVAMSIAEYFQKKGRDVLLIFDDLATHAKFLREIALLEGRLPGRESYPGDIFYQHAHTLERAGRFNEEAGGGSITLLPVLEVELEGYSDLIPTNLIAATDGHLLFSTTRHSEGVYPATSEEQSVTRVGKNTQKLIQKEIAQKIQILLAEYRREKEYVQFGAPVSERTRAILLKGELAYAALEQQPGTSLALPSQILLTTLVFSSFLKEKGAVFFRTNKAKLIEAFTMNPEFEVLRNEVSGDTTFAETLNKLEEKKTILEKVCQS